MADEDTAGVPQPAAEPATPPEAGAVPVQSEAEQDEPNKAIPSVQNSSVPTQTAQIPVNEPLPQVSASAPQAHSGRDLLVKARATIQNRKHIKLEKILEFLNTKGKVTNDDVEKFLHASDATATRYLSQLEKEGKIKQHEKTGKAVTYTKV